MKEMCCIHDIEESDGWYQCFECKHWYQNPEELLNIYNQEAIEVQSFWSKLSSNDVIKSSIKDILFCPLCLHDFMLPLTENVS